MPNGSPFELVIRIMIEEQVDKDSGPMDQLSYITFRSQYDTAMSKPETNFGIGPWQSSSPRTLIIFSCQNCQYAGTRLCCFTAEQPVRVCSEEPMGKRLKNGPSERLNCGKKHHFAVENTPPGAERNYLDSLPKRPWYTIILLLHDWPASEGLRQGGWGD